MPSTATDPTTAVREFQPLVDYLISDIAQKLSVPLAEVRWAIDAKQLAAVERGGQIFVRGSAVSEWLQKGPAPTPQTKPATTPQRITAPSHNLYWLSVSAAAARYRVTETEIKAAIESGHLVERTALVCVQDLIREFGPCPVSGTPAAQPAASPTTPSTSPAPPVAIAAAKPLSRSPDPKGNTPMEAIAQWNALLQAKIDAGMDRAAAVRSLVKEEPTLHQAMLAATNERAGRTDAAQRLRTA